MTAKRCSFCLTIAMLFSLTAAKIDLSPGMGRGRQILSWKQGWSCQFYGGTGEYDFEKESAAITLNAQTASIYGNFHGGTPLNLEICADLLAGDCDMRFSFIDAQEKVFRSSWLMLENGVNRIEFDPSELLAGAVSPVKFSGIALRSEKKKAKLRIGEISIRAIQHNIDFVQIDNTTQYPINVENPVTENPIALRISYLGETTLSAQLNVEFFDAVSQSSETFSKKLVLLPASENIVPLPPSGKLGIRQITYRLVDSSAPDQVQAGTFSIARMIPAGPTVGCSDGFIFGICAHPQRYPIGIRRREAATAALCGAKLLRTDAGWGTIQPHRDNWNFDLLDQTVEIFAQQGMELELIYSYTPKWAIAKDFKPRKEEYRKIHNSRPDYDAWREFVRRTATRYRGKIRFFEAWNEPDLYSFANFSTEEYIEMLKIAGEETHKANPEALLLTGGYTCMPPFHALNDIEHQEKTLSQAQGFYDIHAFHGHGVFSHYSPQIEQMISMRKRLGIKAPWWANETAEPSQLIGELEQAATLWRKLFYSWARGSIGYNWYDLRNDGTDPWNPEHNFGMVTRDFQPKLIYPAYNTIVRNFRNAEFIREITNFKDVHFYEFAQKNRRLAVIWNDDPNISRLLAFRSNAEKAELFDMFDNRIRKNVSCDTMLIPAEGIPKGLVLEAATKFEPVCELIVPEGRMLLHHGTENCFPFIITNPFATPETLQLELVGIGVIELHLNAGETRRVAFDIPAGKTVSTLELKAEIPTLKLSGAIHLPVSTVIKPEQEFQAHPDFPLDQKTQVTILVPADPAKAHLFWQGPQDLSAVVRLALKNNALKLRVDVTDDIHHQSERDGDIWKGDSIQIAVQVPGQRGMWTFGLARLQDSTIQSWTWDKPIGMTDVSLQKSSISRRGAKTIYETEIDLRSIRADKADEVLFNLLINDNDGETRESYIEIAPGLGQLRRSDHYRVINLK